jgi:hypothetical protein
MGVGRNVPENNVVFDPVDRLFAGRLHGRGGEKTLAGRNVHKGNRIQLWMNIFLHGKTKRVKSALPRFVAWIAFANDIHPPPATNDLAVRMPGFGGLQRGYDFHKRFKEVEKKCGVNELL